MKVESLMIIKKHYTSKEFKLSKKTSIKKTSWNKLINLYKDNVQNIIYVKLYLFFDNKNNKEKSLKLNI